jgi:hypothetical protein
MLTSHDCNPRISLSNLLCGKIMCLICVPCLFGQTPDVRASRTFDGEEIQRLTERVVAQDREISAQQARIDALEAGLAEQKELLDKVLGLKPTVLASLTPGSLPPGSLAPAAFPPAGASSMNSPLGSSSISNGSSAAQAPPQTPELTLVSDALRKEEQEQPYVNAAKHWYDKINIRGYMQLRENNLINTNKAYVCDQCDKSIGNDEGFFLRRMRVVLFGDISDHVYFYLQPDFASSSGSSLNYAQLRDAYFDLSFDSKKEHRIRVGQSKIPYGFEILQSSQNRLDLDRTDALNSAAQNERDLGIFYYWAPAAIRARFAELSPLKGSGDYGVFGAGVYNGTGPNTGSNNKYFHTVARVSYPFKLKNGQFIEAGIQGYMGKYTVPSVSETTQGQKDFLYNDQRVAVSLIVYPQPLGFQTEYNWGTGPQYNPQRNYIEQHALNGGYAMVNYRKVYPRNFVITPFARFQYYNGGKKFELDARKYQIVEGDFGFEAQFGKYFEVTPQYQYGDRLFEDGANRINRQLGSLLRLQLQFNY